MRKLLLVCLARAVAGGALGLALGALPAGSRAEETVLENASLRLVLRDGRLQSLHDKARAIEHVTAGVTTPPGLFQIQWVKGIQPAGTLDATAMTARVVRRAPAEAEWEFEHPQALVRARVSLAPAPGESHWSLAVTPRDPSLAVGQVAFPVVATTTTAAGGEEKKYLLPMFEGRLQPLKQAPLWRSYPADLFAQLIACLAPAGGFLLWTDDGDGHVKSFGYQRRDGTAAFAVRHLPAYAAGREWQMPYRTRLSLCGGAWQDAADIYRDWVTVQPWAGTAVRDRRDLPALLKHPPLCLSSQLDQEDLASLPDRLAAWAQRLDAPVVYRPLGWEKHGNWVGIDYLPPALGEKRFRDLAAELRGRGITLAGFISGYRWTTRVAGPRAKTADNAALRQYFDEHGGGAVSERQRDGRLLAFAAEGRDSFRICRGTEFGREFLPATARGLFDLGVAVIHDDQDHGPYPGGQDSCFDPAHGHPVPGGPWATTATRDSFRAIRAEAARRGASNFFLTKESCTELLNMDLHAYQARLFHEATNPGLVPLSQYLFHDRTPVIFGWVTANSRSIWELAAMLVYGQIPSLAFWNAAAVPPGEVPAESIQLLGDYYAAMKTYAKDYLLYGKMRRPLIADAPTARKEITAAKGNKQGQTQVVTVPLVIQSAWEDDRGNVGVFAVNTQRQAIVLNVPAPGPGSWRATPHSGAQPGRTQAVKAGESLVWRLPPGRLEGLVFKRDD